MVLTNPALEALGNEAGAMVSARDVFTARGCWRRTTIFGVYFGYGGCCAGNELLASVVRPHRLDTAVVPCALDRNGLATRGRRSPDCLSSAFRMQRAGPRWRS